MSTLSAYCIVAAAATLPAKHQGRKPSLLLWHGPFQSTWRCFQNVFFFREEKIPILQLYRAHCSHGVDWENEDKALVGVMLRQLCTTTSFSPPISRRKGFKDNLHLPGIML